MQFAVVNVLELAFDKFFCADSIETEFESQEPFFEQLFIFGVSEMLIILRLLAVYLFSGELPEMLSSGVCILNSFMNDDSMLKILI